MSIIEQGLSTQGASDWMIAFVILVSFNGMGAAVANCLPSHAWMQQGHGWLQKVAVCVIWLATGFFGVCWVVISFIPAPSSPLHQSRDDQPPFAP